MNELRERLKNLKAAKVTYLKHGYYGFAALLQIRIDELENFLGKEEKR